VRLRTGLHHADEMPNATVSIVDELENALKDGSPERRTETLRRVTDLFLGNADRLGEQQVKVFDDVLLHLIKRIETEALVQLSASLAPASNAPTDVIRHLAYSEEIRIAAPVLSQSDRLSEEDVIDIAESRGQDHLLAIARRASLGQAVTDVLLRRGDRQVGSELAQNPGARFSENGFAVLVKHAEQDSSLAEKLGRRLDVPPQLLRQLLTRARDEVRARLLETAPAEALDKVRKTVADIADEVGRQVNAPRNFTRATDLVQEINRNGKLNEAVIAEFASQYRYEEMVSALSLLSAAPIRTVESLMTNVRSDGVIIVCKAAGLKWPTVSIILRKRFAHHTVSEDDIASDKRSFVALSQATAQRTLRFWQTQGAARQAG